MRSIPELDDPRRRILVKALSLGLVSAGLPAGLARAQGIPGQPAQMPPGRSIYRIVGEATVSGKPADLQTAVNPGDTVKTAKGSQVIFVVGSQALIARGPGEVVIERSSDTSLFERGLRVLSGGLLSVSRNTRMQLRTNTGTIGVRGTGFYVSAREDETYFCTCYGVSEVAANAVPSKTETITAQRHDRPVYILANAADGQYIRNAPFIDHTDQELALIEALVGREPPFVFPKDSYSAPRRTY